MVEAIFAEYMAKEEAEERGLSHDEWMSHHLEKTDASEKPVEWTRENHSSGMDADDENIAVFVERSFRGVSVHIRYKLSFKAGKKICTVCLLLQRYKDGMEKSLSFVTMPDVFSASNMTMRLLMWSIRKMRWI